MAWIKWGAVALPVAVGVWILVLWQPGRQVELHTLNLLKRASARDWPAVEAMMGADYTDAWGHDRMSAIDDARKVFSQFFALHITALEPLRVETGRDGATAEGPVGIFGSGTAIAAAVMEEVRNAEGTFVFRWRKDGPWPWQWVLVEAGNENLRVRGGFR